MAGWQPAIQAKTLQTLRRLLFKIARSSFSRYFIGWVFTHMSFLIPVNRLRETETLIAFHHPKPTHPTHILLVPKRPIPNMLALHTNDADFLTDLFQAVQSLVAEFQLEQGGYNLSTNGGSYQDVPHLHFHLISDVTPKN